MLQQLPADHSHHSAVDAEMIEYRSASVAVPPMAWAVVGLVYPSWPVVRPDCSSSSICRIQRNRVYYTNTTGSDSSGSVIRLPWCTPA